MTLWKYRGGGFRDSTLTFLLTVSVVLNLALAVTLRNRTARPSQKPFGTAKSVEIVSLDGRHQTLAYTGAGLPTLIYWFSPTCGWCAKNLANLKSLAAQRNGRYRLVPLSIAPTSDLALYAQKNQLDFPIYSISSETRRVYNLRGTPTSLLVSPEGRLMKYWVGAYQAPTAREIERALTIKLAGPI